MTSGYLRTITDFYIIPRGISGAYVQYALDLIPHDDE